jgi:Fe2+ transport system protein FeoA
MLMTLNNLMAGDRATILQVEDSEESGVLVNLGLQQGAEIELIWPSIFNRPMVVKHSENQLVAIRVDVAERIIVEKIK